MEFLLYFVALLSPVFFAISRGHSVSFAFRIGPKRKR